MSAGQAWSGDEGSAAVLVVALLAVAAALVAAVGFAGLLLVILTSGEVRGLLLGLVQKALAVG